MLSHHNKSVNKRAHAVFKQIFLAQHPLREEITPYYLKVALENFPDATPVESLSDTTSAIIQSLPGSHPLAALTIKAVADKIRMMKMAKTSVYLLVTLFRMIDKVHIEMLQLLLRYIDATVRQGPKEVQESLCRLLFKIISSNSDYSRKEMCIKWYLELTHSLGVNANRRRLISSRSRPS